jgi:site-specific DNA-cytosine methylase
MEVRDASEPSACVVATVHAKAAKPRAWLESGRVVSMTPRALARFQSFTDDFILPGRAALACKGIGNALPPLLAERFVESEQRARRKAA